MIHFSLFPNEKCVICHCLVQNNALHCQECEQEWVKSCEKE